MGVSLACGIVLVGALIVVARWRDLTFTAETPPGPAAGRRERARHYLWWVQVVLATGLACGILVMGTGGRLAMRVLGAAGGDRAQNRITEANEVIGEVTIGGTIGFIFFVGVLSGLVTTVIWFALRRFLPPAWLGGLLFGAGLLVVFGTRNDPLRPGNEDFDIVGPWWLAVVLFTALALAYGVALSSFSARLSQWLPLAGRNRRSASYALLFLLVPLFPFGVAALVGGLVYVFGGEVLDRVRAAVTSPGGVRVARVALGAVVLVAAPGFVTAISDLVGRGPG